MSEEHIPTLFPSDNPEPLRGVTRQNAARKLAGVACPCGAVGRFQLFEKAMHVGIACAACGREHPLRSRGVMWLPDVINAWKAGRL